MSRKEMIALKLQMGIDPSVQIAPGILQAMWHQLEFEREHQHRSQISAAPDLIQLTPTPMVV